MASIVWAVTVFGTHRGLAVDGTQSETAPAASSPVPTAELPSLDWIGWSMPIGITDLPGRLGIK
jgi:hypothetical protein